MMRETGLYGLLSAALVVLCIGHSSAAQNSSQLVALLKKSTEKPLPCAGVLVTPTGSVMTARHCVTNAGSGPVPDVRIDGTKFVLRDDRNIYTKAGDIAVLQVDGCAITCATSYEIGPVSSGSMELHYWKADKTAATASMTLAKATDCEKPKYAPEGTWFCQEASAALESGASGSPVIQAGKVVGIVAAVKSKSKDDTYVSVVGAELTFMSLTEKKVTLEGLKEILIGCQSPSGCKLEATPEIGITSWAVPSGAVPQ